MLFMMQKIRSTIKAFLPHPSTANGRAASAGTAISFATY